MHIQKNAQILTIQLSEFSQTERPKYATSPQIEHHQAQRSPLTSALTLRITHILPFTNMDVFELFLELCTNGIIQYEFFRV